MLRTQTWLILLVSVLTVGSVHAKADPAYSRTFALTGIVTRVEKKSCLVDGQGKSRLLLHGGKPPRLGTVIRADILSEICAETKEEILFLLQFSVLGTGSVPPPPLLSPDELNAGKGDYRQIRLRGFITDAVDDEIDERYVIATMNVGGNILYAAADKGPDTLQTLRGFFDADIELTGVYMPLWSGKRRFSGPIITFGSPEKDIRVLSPPLADPFSAPPLESLLRMQANDLVRMKRRTLHGHVLAAWPPQDVLVHSDADLLSRLTLADGETLPEPGETVDAVGFPETDLFTVNLSNAKIRTRDERVRLTQTPCPAGPRDVLPESGRFNPENHGRLLTMSGTVRSVSRLSHRGERLILENDGILFPVDAGTASDAFDGIEIGSLVEVTGVCVLESGSWRPRRIRPTVVGFILVLRTGGDIIVLAKPPWWTPKRFLLVLAGLFLALVTILIQNAVLRRLVERRSRELTRAQAAHLESELRLDERTRIAAELHDYLAQNLTAVSYRLTSARAARDADSESADAQLETAAAMLDSSRTELRRCLWDLKSRALEEPTFDLAIRRSLQQITDFKNLDLAFDVPRTRVSDPTAHAVLSIIRELVANAVNHGLADRITIRGEIRDKTLEFSVTDNGYGFDPDTVSASDDGHFGLDGIRQRVKRLDGTFEIVSRPANGTRAVVRIPFHPAV